MKKIILFALMIFFIPLYVNAATGIIDVSSSSKKIAVGNTFNVTVNVSSTDVLGTWEYTIDYDSSKIKLISGDLSIVGYTQNATSKSASYSYKFKAIASGNSTITVKSYGIIDYESEASVSTSVSPVNINTFVQEVTPVTYSTNDYLKSLSVDGYTLSPEFNKNTMEYTVKLNSDVEKINITYIKDDNSSTVLGGGEILVSEGDNKVELIVTSEKGNKRTYTIIATVEDLNPINVTIDNENFSVIKRGSSLIPPNNFILTKVNINEQEVPAFYNDITKYTLVALKNSSGESNLYIYEDGFYALYNEYNFDNIILYPINKDISLDRYKKTNIKIDDEDVTVYKINDNSKFCLIYGVNMLNNEEDIYMYDITNNTLQKYNIEEITLLEKKIENANTIIFVLISSTVLSTCLLIVIILKKTKKKRKKEAKTIIG